MFDFYPEQKAMTEQAFFSDDADSADSFLQPRLSDCDAQQLACLFKALADPTRLHILDILSQSQGHVGACELAGIVGIPNSDGQRPQQPTISHHLKVLKQAGLICCEKEQQWVYYFICEDRFSAVRSLIEMIRQPVQ